MGTGMDSQLDEWFRKKAKVKSNAACFPRLKPEKYLAQYNSLVESLGPIHEEVEKAAMNIEGGYLTDHGPEHIARVVQRASDLVFGLKIDITPYEAYLLLVAIQLHDIGNGLGRDLHERRIGEVVAMLGNKLGDDHAEIRLIQRIAVAHGGHVGDNTNDKDTLNELPKYEPFGDKRVMVQLLAAVLRLADELADDNSRSSRYASYFQSLPVSSEVFHEYARSLHTVIVNAEDKRIELGFEMTPEDAKRKWGKLNQQIYLFDEIHERTWKMYRECIYCMRYMRASKSNIRVIEAVKVKIEMLNNKNKSVYTPYGGGNNEPIEYVIQERGYPKREAKNLAEFVESLNPCDGTALKRILIQRERERRTQNNEVRP